MFKFLKDLFIPHERNNHRAKLLHNSSILALVLIIIFSSFVLNYVSSSRPDILGISYSISEGELLALVNQKRQEQGLTPLNLDPRLSDASRRKASDMFSKNYWAHFSPDGATSPWGFIRDSGYNYLYAGENLAKGFTDSGSVVNAWMSSQTHRDNILSGKYQDVGFAVVEGHLQGEETVLIVEMFGATQSRTLATVPPSVEAASEELSPEVTSIPTPLPTIVVEEVKVSTPSVITESKVSKPAIDSKAASKTASIVGLSFLAFALVMDLVIVERKKIPRIVGHNLDHLMLIIMFIIFLVLRTTGVIL